MLNTSEFTKAWQELQNAKNPDLPFYLQSNGYAYLVGMLTSFNEAGISVNQSQKIIDETTQELKQELSDLSDKLELQK